MISTRSIVFNLQFPKMFAKSSWLIVFVITVCDAHSFTPFDIVDNYVDQFRLNIENVGKLAEEYRFVQEEYDSLAVEDAKLLLGKL